MSSVRIAPCRPCPRRGRRRGIAAAERNVGRLDFLAGLEQHHGVLDGVLELAHVAGPRMIRERAQRGVRELRQRRAGAAVTPPVSLQDVLASMVMSSGRSRSGGMWIGTTRSR